MERCGRCGVIEREELSVLSKPISKLMLDEKSDPVVLGAMMASKSDAFSSPQQMTSPDVKFSPDDIASTQPSYTINLDQVKKRPADEALVKNTFLLNDKKMEALIAKNSKKLKNVNRRSRALSWHFVNKVGMPKNDLEIPMPVMEENIGAQPHPVVNAIIELAPQYKTRDGTLAVDAIEKLLIQEKKQGTPWREIADETIMELILNGLNGNNFVAALINAYDIPTYDVGLFLATPPDEGTMSLIEEAVCQDSLDLFYEVLKMDENLLMGVYECKDTTDEVHREIVDLLDDIGAKQ